MIQIEGCSLGREVTAQDLQTEEQQAQVNFLPFFSFECDRVVSNSLIVNYTDSSSCFLPLYPHKQAAGGWKVVLPRTRLGPGAQHLFTLAANEINNVSVCIHKYLYS